MSYSHLTQEQRCVIAHLWQTGQGVRAISRQLNRSPSTISRELDRNAPPGDRSDYRAQTAQQHSDRRRRDANARRDKLRHKPLQQAVKDGLKQRWSPKLISERLRRLRARRRQADQAMSVSAPTIYAWLKRHTASGGRWEKQLPRRGKGRRPNGSCAARRDAMPGRRCITERPPGAQNRSRLGHWEGDTVEGAYKASYLVTLVDRKSRLSLLGMSKDKSVATINAVIQSLLGRLPRRLCRTVTLDNGTEFSGHEQLEQASGVTIYFAHPYSPWERGTNEQLNGLLRIFLPKGTDFRRVTGTQLAKIEVMLNNRPRKCLNYRTPREVFKPPPAVALRT